MSERMQAEENFSDYNIKFLNLFLKNKRSTYEFISNTLGIYLPAYESKAINEEYLLKVMQKKVYVLKRDQVHPAPELKQKTTVMELMEEIKNLGQDLNYGFDIFFPPDKNFLINLLFSLKKDHPFFTSRSEDVNRKLDQE